MITNRDYLQQLAEKIKSSPIWIGQKSILGSTNQGYTGVRLFAEYVADLKLKNSDKIPANLDSTERVRNAHDGATTNDYVEFLNIRGAKTKEEEDYYTEIIPYIQKWIDDGILSNDQLVEFAQIFNELNIGGISLEESTADYLNAINEAMKISFTKIDLKDETINGILKESKGKITAEDLKNLHTDKEGEIYKSDGTKTLDLGGGGSITITDEYKASLEIAQSKKIELEFSTLEKETIKKKIYVNKEGNLYFEDGSEIKDEEIIQTIKSTLRYKKSQGEVSKLDFDREDFYADKEGNIYNLDGAILEDSSLQATIKNTDEYKKAEIGFAKTDPQTTKVDAELEIKKDLPETLKTTLDKDLNIPQDIHLKGNLPVSTEKKGERKQQAKSQGQGQVKSESETETESEAEENPQESWKNNEGGRRQGMPGVNRTSGQPQSVPRPSPKKQSSWVKKLLIGSGITGATAKVTVFSATFISEKATESETIIKTIINIIF